MRNTILVIAALLLAAGLLCLPTPEGLSPQGHMLLAVTGCMLVLWVLQAVDFSASSFFLLGLMALGCGLTADPAAPDQALGAVRGVRLAMQGFASPAWVLVCSALFIASEVDASGLGKRISLRMLSLAGTSPSRIRLATICLTLALSLIIPSPAANSGLCTVLMLSVVRLLGIPLNGNLAKSIFLIVAFGPALSTVMVLTAGGGPVQTASFIYQGTGHDLSWMEYFICGAPMGLGLCVAMYLLLQVLFPAGGESLPDTDALLCKAMAGCGPWTRQEKSIAVILALIIPLWATSKVLHPVDTATIAILAVAAIFTPGVMERGVSPAWKALSEKVAWGTLMLFGAVLSLGQALLDSGAASWLARATLVRMGLAEWPLLAVIVTGGLLFALLGLAFSARSAAIGALTPTIIGFAMNLPPEKGVPVWGLTLVMNYALQFTILVPANSPMAMIAISSNTFTPGDMLRFAVPLVGVGFALLLFFSLTWWPLLGVL